MNILQFNKKREGKSCIGGAKDAAKEYLPPPSKMSGVTFHLTIVQNKNKLNFLKPVLTRFLFF